MATTGGAMTTPFGDRIGSLAVGRAADLVLIDWDKIAYPYLDPETPVLDAVVQRGRTDAVDLVMVAGEIIYQDGRFTRALTGTPRCGNCGTVATRPDHRGTGAAPPRPRWAILPHVKAFYRKRLLEMRRRAFEPFYRPELAHLTPQDLLPNTAQINCQINCSNEIRHHPHRLLAKARTGTRDKPPSRNPGCSPPPSRARHSAVINLPQRPLTTDTDYYNCLGHEPKMATI